MSLLSLKGPSQYSMSLPPKWSIINVPRGTLVRAMIRYHAVWPMYFDKVHKLNYLAINHLTTDNLCCSIIIILITLKHHPIVITDTMTLLISRVRWETSHSFWNVGMASDAENQLDRTENPHMDLGEDWYTRRKGILEQIKHRKLSECCQSKRRSDSVVLATTESEIEGKCFPGRRRTAWIDDVQRWTSDDMNVARTNAMERRYDCW